MRTTLRVIEADVPIREDAGVRIDRRRCYKGTVPGPTLKIRAGEELRIRQAEAGAEIQFVQAARRTAEPILSEVVELLRFEVEDRALIVCLC